jgi:hypothetical protein
MGAAKRYNEETSGISEAFRQIPVLVERVKGDGYRARGTEPFAITAKGSTRAEALAKLRAKIESRIKKGTEIVSLEVGPQPHPLAEFAGMFKDDADFEDVLKIIAENRRKMDKDPDVP